MVSFTGYAGEPSVGRVDELMDTMEKDVSEAEEQVEEAKALQAASDDAKERAYYKKLAGYREYVLENKHAIKDALEDKFWEGTFLPQAQRNLNTAERMSRAPKDGGGRADSNPKVDDVGDTGTYLPHIIAVTSLLFALAAFSFCKYVLRDPRQRPYKKAKRKARPRPQPPQPQQQTTPKKKNKPRPASPNKIKKPPMVRSKNRRRAPNSYKNAPVDQMIRFKQRWMMGMQRVHAEAGAQFKQRRQELDARQLERSPPKKKKAPATFHSHQDVPAFAPTTTGGKAGRSQYLVQVGAADHLHRTYKSSARRGRGHAATPVPEVDLHGMTRAEALAELEARLPRWVEAAMTGAAPWVITVRIVCGGGNQVLSEAVAHWIREQRQVSKAPTERRP